MFYHLWSEFQFPVDSTFQDKLTLQVIPKFESIQGWIGFIEQKVNLIIGIEVNCNELSFNELHLTERHQQTEE